jgi:eukaryotic-like serine/threonine-protein kinase
MLRDKIANVLHKVTSRDELNLSYRLIKVLGEGGDGIVFLAQSSNGDFYAVKIFHSNFSADQHTTRELSLRLRRWINLGTYPFLVEGLSHGYYKNRVVLVMEYVAPDQRSANTSLRDHIRSSDGPLNFSLVIRWAIQVCYAMEYANSRGVDTHGDMKPSNILITADKNAKLTDFGSDVTITDMRAQSFSAKTIEYLYSRCCLLANGRYIHGTPGYISPEVYRGEKADVRSDLFSFGLVLWQMVTGRGIPPFFEPDDESGVCSLDLTYRNQMTCKLPDTDSPLDSIIRRCLTPPPLERFNDFSCLRQELERLVYLSRD